MTRSVFSRVQFRAGYLCNACAASASPDDCEVEAPAQDWLSSSAPAAPPGAARAPAAEAKEATRPAGAQTEEVGTPAAGEEGAPAGHGIEGDAKRKPALDAQGMRCAVRTPAFRRAMSRGALMLILRILPAFNRPCIMPSTHCA